MPDTVNSNKESLQEKNYEFSSLGQWLSSDDLFQCSIYNFFNKEEIRRIIEDPITNYREAIRLSQLVYNKNGIVSNSIDYCTSLMTLDRIVTSESKNRTAIKNRKLMHNTLKCINDKHFIH